MDEAKMAQMMEMMSKMRAMMDEMMAMMGDKGQMWNKVKADRQMANQPGGPMMGKMG